MLKPSRKAWFALVAVLDIACHAGGQPVQSQDINHRQGIPRRYLEKSLQHLVRSGLLQGVRGPRGGYRLALERRRITVGAVLRAVQKMEEEGTHNTLPDSALGQMVVRPLWDDMQDALMKRLEAVSIDDLCLRARREGLFPEAGHGIDFTI